MKAVVFYNNVSNQLNVLYKNNDKSPWTVLVGQNKEGTLLSYLITFKSDKKIFQDLFDRGVFVEIGEL